MLPVRKLAGFTPGILGLGLVVTVASAQPVPPAPAPPAQPAPAPPTVPGPTILRIVELTQPVGPGAPMAAFTVPGGSRLVITDVLVTNPNVLPACGVSVSRSVAPAGGPAALQSVTGALCVSPQSTLDLALVTGLEFSETESLQLVNGATGAADPVSFHLRGVLLAPELPTGEASTTGSTGTPDAIPQ
ncbi:MAG: hypothetical protein ACREJV_03625 [Candidatus Rokuibacteriota bacterium]